MRQPPGDTTASRALVSIAAARPRGGFDVLHRPAAPFLAHLIATAQQAPQTRTKRRAEPVQAHSAYTGSACPQPPSLRRSA